LYFYPPHPHDPPRLGYPSQVLSNFFTQKLSNHGPLPRPPTLPFSPLHLPPGRYDDRLKEEAISGRISRFSSCQLSTDPHSVSATFLYVVFFFSPWSRLPRDLPRNESLPTVSPIEIALVFRGSVCNPPLQSIDTESPFFFHRTYRAFVPATKAGTPTFLVFSLFDMWNLHFGSSRVRAPRRSARRPCLPPPPFDRPPNREENNPSKILASETWRPPSCQLDVLTAASCQCPYVSMAKRSVPNAPADRKALV